MIGFVLTHKPVGPSSFQWLKKISHQFRLPPNLEQSLHKERWGHSGTLDPFAHGLLFCGLGNATRLFPLMEGESKTYQARLLLGEATDTQDSVGKIIATAPVPDLSVELVEATLRSFLGPQTQIPPNFSAKKVHGQRAYDLARKGLLTDLLPSHNIVVEEIKMLSYQASNNSTGHSFLDFEVSCSAGTYVRTLGCDIARKLGTVGHLQQLCRTAIGAFKAPPEGEVVWLSLGEWVKQLSAVKAGNMSTMRIDCNDFESMLLKNGTIPTIHQEKIRAFAEQEILSNPEQQKYPILLEFWYRDNFCQLGQYWLGQQKIIAQVMEV